MSKIQINGAELYYEDTGGQGKEVIVFSHGLLFSCRMFDDQVEALKDHYRCVAYDHRGQGQSEVTADGYDMDSLYEDAAALIQALECAPCHFVGLSMGGFVGLRLAARRPELLKSLILLETSADPEPPESAQQYRRLNFIARWFGLRIVVGRVMPVMFGKTFLNDPTRATQCETWKQHILANDRIGITRAVKGVVDRLGVYDEIGQITVPTLIMVGDEDVATVPAKADRMHARIPNSELVIIPDAGHTSTVEEPQAVNDVLIAFLNDLPSKTLLT